MTIGQLKEVIALGNSDWDNLPVFVHLSGDVDPVNYITTQWEINTIEFGFSLTDLPCVKQRALIIKITGEG